MATMNRRTEALRSLERLSALPERPSIVLVDNGSSDGTASAVRSACPAVDVVELGRNRGAVARNVGVARARTPYVAFSDDDSWWAPGALSLAADALDGAPRLALVAARILLGPDEGVEPTCLLMADSPLVPAPDLPGTPILGFVACGAMVRRDAFLEVGGFSELLFFYGEETLLALDLAQANWGLAYLDDVVAHHHPSAIRDLRERRRLEARNRFLSTWLRRPLGTALSHTARALRVSWGDGAVRRGTAQGLLGLPSALVGRRVISPQLERQVRLLERRG